MSSSISLTKIFEDLPFRISMNMNHSQNMNTGNVDMTIPSLTINADRWYPFAPEGLKENWIQKIGIDWDLSAENRISTQDSLLFTSEMFKDAKNGIRQSLRTSTSLKILKYLNFSASVSYNEKWYFKRTKKYWGKDP